MPADLLSGREAAGRRVHVQDVDASTAGIGDMGRRPGVGADIQAHRPISDPDDACGPRMSTTTGEPRR